MNEPAPFLPYRCERLRSEHLQKPCAGNLNKIKALRRGFPNAHIGPLEHCLECQGKDLIIRAAPVAVIDQSADLPPAAPQNGEEMKMAGVVAFKDESETERVLGPGKLPGTAPRCPKHPQEFQMECSGSGKRAGQFMGACKVCLAERKVGRKSKPGMTAAVARDLQGKINVSAMAELPQEFEGLAWDLKDMGAVAGDPPRCAKHNLPLKFNKLGVSMGGCEVCRQEIAARGGQRARDILAGGFLERLFAEYPEDLAWLRGLAQNLIRTPEEQLVYICRKIRTDGRYAA